MAKKKNFTHNVRDDDVEAPAGLEPAQAIARVVKATSANTWECELPSKETVLVQLQAKLHNNVWVRRGGFVLVEAYPEGEATGKVAGEIVNVVLDEKKWRKMAYWWVLLGDADANGDREGDANWWQAERVPRKIVR